MLETSTNDMRVLIFAIDDAFWVLSTVLSSMSRPRTGGLELKDMGSHSLLSWLFCQALLTAAVWLTTAIIASDSYTN